ncbi:MAG: hypothetical protein JWR69_410 [Pedosphaera sp.]|nr:hypothetical protein [Pedosphaera sp.]
MKRNTDHDRASQNGSPPDSRWIWLLIIACALVILIGLRRPTRHHKAVSSEASTDPKSVDVSSGVPNTERTRWGPHRSSSAPAQTADEIVASKVKQFGRSRREIAHRIAHRLQKDVPVEVEAFFDAIESGRWEEINARWDVLAKRSGQYNASEHAEELNPFWSAVLDAYGVAEQAHDWPAQKLLDYGDAVLDSLRPGMVYIGGTDNGRWIPELLNDTSGGEQHVILTQNALADGRYADWMRELYGDRLATLSEEDSQRAFEEYTADAQKRLEHDQQFPDEPKQIRPGEEVKMVDGRVQVSSQVGVMAINEKLLQMLMDKNPDLSFALQESFPLKGTYGDALPLGPLMELRAQDGETTFTAERAAQSLDYWRDRAQQVFSDPEAANSPSALKSYSHDAVSAANLLASHHFADEAEQTYRLGMQLWPENAESAGGLADLLASTGRKNEARQVLDEFVRQHPAQKKDLEQIGNAWRIISQPQTGKP